MFIIYISFPSPAGALVIIEMKPFEKFFLSVMFLFYILQKNYHNKSYIFF